MRNEDSNLIESTLMELAFFLISLLLFGFTAVAYVKSGGVAEGENDYYRLDAHYFHNNSDDCEEVSGITTNVRNQEQKYSNRPIVFEKGIAEINKFNEKCISETCLNLFYSMVNYKDDIFHIFFDGNASSEYDIPKDSCNNDGFDCNMKLSLDRASKVYLKCKSIIKEIYAKNKNIDNKRDKMKIKKVKEAFQNESDMKDWFSDVTRPIGHSSAHLLLSKEGSGKTNGSEKITHNSAEKKEYDDKFVENHHYSRRVEIRIFGNNKFMKKLAEDKIISAQKYVENETYTGSLGEKN